MNNNPYAVNGSNQTYTNPYGNSNPYATTSSSATAANPYLALNNNSSASVNTNGSRGDRSNAVNPYVRPQGARQYQATVDAPYDRDGRPRSREYPNPTTAGQDSANGSRAQQYGDGSRSRERRAISDARDVPNSYSRPPLPTQNLQSALPSDDGVHGVNRQHFPRRSLKSMDEILVHIQNNWKIMEGDECIPVKVALQLADPSSLGLGHKETDFADTHMNLQRTLKSVVNEHYADFNSAVGTYHKIQASIRESQSRVRYLKTGLIAVRGSMLSTRPELRNLAEQSGELDELLSTVSQMEALRAVPARLEEKINEKRWIGAVEILNDALVSSRRTGFEHVGAMSDLRSYFTNQESSLIDMLIEELHDHLYLKSPYCVDRWKGRKMNSREANAGDNLGGNAWDRPVYHFLSALDTKIPMSEDASKNPESDTFYYIQTIVEALNRQGYLEELVTRIEQRLPVELYKVVEKTNQEIDAKYPSHLREQATRPKPGAALLQASDEDSRVLSDFLWTLYAKFEAIAEGHRVLHEVVLGVVDREQLPQAEQYSSSFKELWKLYQLEIRSLLHDYLATDSEIGAGGGKHSMMVGDLFIKHPRDKGKRMFKLSEVGEKSSDVRTEEDELEEILKASVPGLVSKRTPADGSLAPTHDAYESGSAAAGHKLLIEPSVFNMTILLPPSLTFLQHLKEIVPITSSIPVSTLTSFLDDFLINVFHPQLEEAVTELCTSTMVDFEAFLEDPAWSKHSTHPIFRGVFRFMNLVYAFSAMLSSIPQDQMFTQLIITQLFKYYDRCYGFYKSLVSRSSQSTPISGPGVVTTIMKTAAEYVETEEMHDTILSLWRLESPQSSQRMDLIDKEVRQLLTAARGTPIQAWDIISDPKSVRQLSLIYNSMQWLSAALMQLRHVKTDHKSHGRNSSLTSSHNQRRWTLITNLKTDGSLMQKSKTSMTDVYLPLTSETVVPFDETVGSFRSLAQKALFTIHIDVRCGIIHQLSRNFRPTDPPQAVSSPRLGQVSTASRESAQSPLLSTPLDPSNYPFLLAAPPQSASPRILELNSDLISFDANIASYLGTKERQFVLTGLGRLVDRYLIVGADYIQVMNKEGAGKMRIDAVVVQQVLRGLGLGNKHSSPSRVADKNDVNLAVANPSSTFTDNEMLLTDSLAYYDLFLQGPDRIMSYVRACKRPSSGSAKQDISYTYDELRTLIELCFSVALRGDDREESVMARKRMGDLLLGLGELMWDS